VTVIRGTIASTVTVSGAAKPISSADLAFETSGKVQKTYAGVGDLVKAGQLLISLDTAEFSADVEDATAALKAAEADLQKILAGAKPAEIAVSEAKLASAIVAEGEAKQNLSDTVKDAYTKADDAIHAKVDQFISNPGSTNPMLMIGIGSGTLKNAIESQRVMLESMFASWAASIGSATLGANATLSQANLATVQKFLDLVAQAVNSANASSAITQATLDAYKADVSTARTNVNAAVANLSAAQEKLSGATAAATLASQELTLVESPATPETIAAAEAKVAQASAKRNLSLAKLAKRSLWAPFDGTVTKQEATAGEIVAANQTMVSVISASNLELEANVPEVSVGGVAVGNPVSIIFDAFPGEIFTGTLHRLDPAETIVDGVVNFKIKVSISNSDPRLKSGLTANLVITTAARNDVLLVPQSAIKTALNGTGSVWRVSGTSTAEVTVTLGIRGSDGLVEIASGLTEGDTLLRTP
jgi:HlyD family secretion protein